MSEPIIMLDGAGNPLSVGLSVLWKGHGCRDFRVGWVRDISLFGGKPAVRVDDGAEWDADLNGRTWSATEWIDEPKRIRPRREQPKPDPRFDVLESERDTAIAEADALRAEVARLQANPLATLLHRIPATEAPFVLAYHPDADPMLDGSGWLCEVDDWSTHAGPLDAVIAAACDRLGVGHG